MKKQSQNIFTMALLMAAAFLFIWVMLNLVQGLYSILAFVAPFLLIGALVVNHKVVLKYSSFLFNKLKTNPITGIAYMAGTFFLFPLVAAFLFAAAFGSKKLESVLSRAEMEHMVHRKAEEAEFEIIDDNIEVDIVDLEPEILELPEQDIIESKTGTKNSKYEDLF